MQNTMIKLLVVFDIKMHLIHYFKHFLKTYLETNIKLHVWPQIQININQK